MGKKSLVLKIELLPEFEAEIKGNEIILKNKSGSLKKIFPEKEMKIKKEGNSLLLEIASKKKRAYAIMNSSERHIQNMMNGLSKGGFEYHLRVVYSHFPINVAIKGSTVEINNFLGEKLPRIAKILSGASVEAKGKEIFVRGFDKEAVGQTAANIEGKTKVNSKDRRVFQDGIFLVKKNLGRAE